MKILIFIFILLFAAVPINSVRACQLSDNASAKSISGLISTIPLDESTTSFSNGWKYKSFVLPGFGSAADISCYRGYLHIQSNFFSLVLIILSLFFFILGRYYFCRRKGIDRVKLFKKVYLLLSIFIIIESIIFIFGRTSDSITVVLIAIIAFYGFLVTVNIIALPIALASLAVSLSLIIKSFRVDESKRQALRTEANILFLYSILFTAVLQILSSALL